MEPVPLLDCDIEGVIDCVDVMLVVIDWEDDIVCVIDPLGVRVVEPVAV